MLLLLIIGSITILVGGLLFFSAFFSTTSNTNDGFSSTQDRQYAFQQEYNRAGKNLKFAIIFSLIGVACLAGGTASSLDNTMAFVIGVASFLCGGIIRIVMQKKM